MENVTAIDGVCPAPEFVSFDVWKTIKIGTFRNMGEVRSRLSEVNCEIGERAETLLRNDVIQLFPYEKEIDLVLLSGKELGFTRNPVYYGNIFNRGFERRLESCPAEVALQLCLQYRDQPEGEVLRIVSTDRLVDEYDRQRILVVTKRGRTLLTTSGGWSDLSYALEDVFVFVRPRV